MGPAPTDAWVGESGVSMLARPFFDGGQGVSDGSCRPAGVRGGVEGRSALQQSFDTVEDIGLQTTVLQGIHLLDPGGTGDVDLG